MEIYVNGTAVSTYGSTFSVNLITANRTHWYFGNDSDNTMALDGLMDEILIYDRCLSVSEIQALYFAGAGKFYPF